MWVAAKLFFSGVIEKVLEWGSAAIKWLFSDWRNGPLVLCALMWAAHALLITPNLRADIATLTGERDRAQVQTGAVRAAFAGTVANFRAASAAAQRAAEANVERVEAEQAAITQEITNDYENRLAAARSRADELRGAASRTTADPRGADAAGLSGSGAAASSADAAPADPRLPSACPADRVCLTLDEALTATEQAIQLDALISWVERQAAVPFQTEVQDDE
jgi:hypothetical protein